MRYLLTGASGFVGANVLRSLIERDDVTRVYCPLSGLHGGDAARLRWAAKRHPGKVSPFYHDLRIPFSATTRHILRDIDVIYHIASDSHVDRAIRNPVPFVENNVSIQLNMLEFARHVEPRLFLQMSTDEVYGPVDLDADDASGEWDPIRPSNPYAASKAAQEAIAFSYWRTYGVPLVITNTMNLYGPTQHPEKFIPKCINAIRSGSTMQIHVDPVLGAAGQRTYIHVDDFALAWQFLVDRYVNGDASGEVADLPTHAGGFSYPARFNVVGPQELSNLEVFLRIAVLLGEENPRYREIDFHSSRPGHDIRYALDPGKLSALGWDAPTLFADGIRDTVEFAREHPEWNVE